MSSKTHQYRLDISPDASTSERAQMFSLLKDTGSSVTPSYNQHRSRSYGADSVFVIEYLDIIATGDLENSAVHAVVDSDPVFDKGKLTQIC